MAGETRTTRGAGAIEGRGNVAELLELALLFLKLGATAVGGPAAHIAMMEDEVVRRRSWLTREQFLDLVGAANLIPGPNSTELAIHIGRMRAGWRGLLVAGVAFIAPAAVIVTLVARAYASYGTLPDVRAAFYGVRPVIVAIVLGALLSLGRTAVKNKGLAVLAAAALVLAALGVNEVAVLLLAGISAVLARSVEARGRAMSLVAGPLVAAAAAPATFSLSLLFLFFLKVGSVLFGSGYVLLAFLRADLVERWHWLTESQLLDAVAVGQMTPGPVFTTATFIGYVLARGEGALVATVGIFLPAFVFVAASAPLVPRLRQSITAGAFLDGVNVASLALMALVTFRLGRAAIVDGMTLAIGLLSFLVLSRWRVNSVWLIVAGGAVGWAISAAARA
jgi:chromate transporter